MSNTGQRLWRHFDFILLGATLLLIIIGVAFVYSATLGVESFSELVQRQILYGLGGMVVMLVVAAFDYRLWSAMQWGVYGLIVGLLILLFALGQVYGGALGWFNVGLFAIQPAELAKPLLIVALAALLAHYKDRLNELGPVLGSLVYMGIPTALIFAQPDLGGAIVMLVVWAAMIWVAGLRLRHAAFFIAIAMLSLPALWLNMQKYQQDRVLAIVDPDRMEPDIRYMRDQALISIGSSDWLGKGFASGSQTQLHFLRVRHTDFIFSVIVEEGGLLGATIVLGLIAIVLWRILSIARLARDDYGRLICIGVATVIFFQTFVSVGMNLGILPITGLTLPFISYGGSSLITLLLSIGFVQSVAMRQKLIEF